MKKIPAYGPSDATIMVVGEAPGSTEELQGRPFVGTSGIELTSMLHEAGITRNDCYITNVCKYRPPSNDISKWFLKRTAARKAGVTEIMGRYPDDIIREGLLELYEEIETVNPKIIIALGDTALWALTGESGITKWRGSQLTYHDRIPILVTYHPAAILRMWSWRFIMVQDLRRVNKILANQQNKPGYSFIIRPSFNDTIATISDQLAAATKGTIRLAVDIETRQRHIACIGFAWSSTEAICIPLMDVHKPLGYWDNEEEASIIYMLARLLLHPNVEVVGQNWIYDMQYIARYWGFIPWPHLDTMLAHHTLFPGLPKGLDFISSLYCNHHVYWKDEGKQWDPRYVDEENLWAYNCTDCVRTYEASYEIEGAAQSMGLEAQVANQMSMVRPVLISMLRGIRVDMSRREAICKQLLEAMIHQQNFLNYVLDRDFNPRSSPQMKQLFYNELGVPPILHKKTKQPTLAKDALGTLRKKADPILYPIIDAIIEFRRCGTFYSVASVNLDRDQRLRCSYNLAGTETFRLASSEDAFGYGTNLQNISKGDK